jgi:hypothetical protein
MSAGEIAATNHAARRDGAVLEVRPYARRVAVAVPGGVRELRVEAPDDVLAGWSIGRGPSRSFAEPAPLDGAGTVEVRLRARVDVQPTAVAAPAWRPWPRLRRAATEARDRAWPLVARRAV